MITIAKIDQMKIASFLVKGGKLVLMEQIENGPFNFAPIIFRMLSALPCLPVPFWLRNAISSPSIQKLNKRNPTIELSIMNNM